MALTRHFYVPSELLLAVDRTNRPALSDGPSRGVQEGGWRAQNEVSLDFERVGFRGFWSLQKVFRPKRGVFTGLSSSRFGARELTDALFPMSLTASPQRVPGGLKMRF